MSKYVDVYDCPVGSLIKEDIYKEDSNVALVTRDTELTEHIRYLLMTHGIFELLIATQEDFDQLDDVASDMVEPDISDEIEDEIKHLHHKKLDFESFSEDFTEHIDILDNVFQNIAKGEHLDLESLNNVSMYYIDKLDDLLSIIQYIQHNFEKDDYTFQHSLNVGVYTLFIGKGLNFSKERLNSLMLASILHDVGKSKISLDLLNKTGDLTDEEYAEMKNHVIYGYNLCKTIPNISKDTILSVLFHHERSDGSGYPKGIKDDKIPLFAKIIAVADVYDALTSKRSYKDKMSPFDTFQIMLNLGYSKELDLKLVTMFVKNISEYYVGAHIRFEDGSEGEIVFIPPRDIKHPLIKIGDNIIDTSVERDYRHFELI